MFMGYPRSGHTLVASMLNAHPNVMCSNQFFIIQDAEEKNLEGILKVIENGSTYQNWKPEVKIPSPPKQDLYVVGDKTGHRTVEYLISNPEQLDALKKIIPWPIKWVHVVRNPFDCLSTWTRKNFDSRKNKKYNDSEKTASLNQEFKGAFNKFKQLNNKIAELKKTEDVLTLLHEQVVMKKDKTMKKLLNFLELEKSAEWRQNVIGTLWKKPRITRRNITWNSKMTNQVMNATRQYPWLDGYYFGG